ncbi:hypothetical protein FACS18942_08860 [Planctomycetales bacterium]|nr:hypothetical protein FACS18942_08860 [Planctomycetales bacterium]
MGGGMGGMGGGMGGMGGGGMGGGMFSVPNALRSMYGASRLGGKAANGFSGGMFSVPSERVTSESVPQEKSVVDNQNIEVASKQLVKEASEAANPRDFWESYFSGSRADNAVVKAVASRMIDQLRAKKRGKDGLQNAQAMKNDATLENQIIALVESAILNDSVQPWMYEALALSLYLIDAPKKQIERAVLSSADFCETPLDLMNIGMFANGVGLKQRAFLLYKQALEVMPPKNEFYAAALRLAQELNDEAAIRWVGLAVLSIEWDGLDGGRLTQNAYDTLAGLYHRMLKEKRDEEAAVLENEVVDVCRRDCIVTVQWAGDAGVDLSVREPSDSFCWFGNPRTISGGLLKMKPVDAQGVRTGTLSESNGTKQIAYVCPRGFNGRYTVVLHKDWGTPANNLVKVSVVINGFTGQKMPKSETVELDPNGTIVYFDLQDGRRTEKIEEAELTEAAMRTSAAEQLIARNDAIKRLADTGVVAQIVGGGSGEYGGYGGTSSGSSSSRYMPYFGRDVVGYQPVITTLPDGSSLSSNAVVSADRRYVRMSPVPVFTSIRKVTPFNMAYGAGDDQNSSSGMGGMGSSGGMGGSSGSGGGY